ncbi:MAG: hypothetical protein JWN17_2130 [Frankiales bacterium]|nr:hypothetical protein [Frankiales bacterium]
MRRTLLGTALLLALAGCSAQEPAAAPSPTPTPTTAVPTVVVTAGDSGPVRAEVADDEQERAVGLMGRTSVPRGTGMVFRYALPSSGRYYMFHVPVPLTAVFARSGVVVGVLDMPPCPAQQPQDCPTYGPDKPFDTVLETAPETVRGTVTVGDPLRVSG